MSAARAFRAPPHSAPPEGDDLPLVQSFRPNDSSSTAIRAAFYRLADARKTNAAEIERLAATRPAMLMTATPPEIERCDETIRRRGILSEQMDVMEAELRQSFTIAKEREEDAEYATKLAEIQATEAAWNADVRSRYPALAAEIVGLLEREGELLSAFRALSRMPGAARARHDLGATMSHPSGGMQKGFWAANANSDALGAIIRLPSLEPSPALWARR
jgi:hypothetical protein